MPSSPLPGRSGDCGHERACKFSVRSGGASGAPHAPSSPRASRAHRCATRSASSARPRPDDIGLAERLPARASPVGRGRGSSRAARRLHPVACRAVSRAHVGSTTYTCAGCRRRRDTPRPTARGSTRREPAPQARTPPRGGLRNVAGSSTTPVPALRLDTRWTAPPPPPPARRDRCRPSSRPRRASRRRRRGRASPHRAYVTAIRSAALDAHAWIASSFCSRGAGAAERADPCVTSATTDTSVGARRSCLASFSPALEPEGRRPSRACVEHEA